MEATSTPQEGESHDAEPREQAVLEFREFRGHGRHARLYPGNSSHGGKRIDSFSLTKDEAGNIVIQSDFVFKAPTILMMDKEYRPSANPADKDASIEYHFNVVVTDESLERFAGADWKSLDVQEMVEIEGNTDIPHCAEEAAKTLPDDFKLDVSVDLSFKVHADELS